jgi:fused signal recognition particle receptor
MNMGFFEKIKQGLKRTTENIGHSFDQLFAGELNDDFYDELEETLILSDMGVDTALEVVDVLRAQAKEKGFKDTASAREALQGIIARMLLVGDGVLDLSEPPAVVLFIGVNGVGKTTTIGKLAARLKDEGKKVLLCAGDTFRAAAADQLTIWSERSRVDIVRQHEGADPAAVVFDALSAAKARGCDAVLVDTAGRLHNKQNLMNELNKISRVVDRECPNSSRETLLVLDATTGQNGLIQAQQFKEAAGITGIVLTKLDGTAKGGIVVAIARQMGLPVKYIGVGEGVDDLMPFDPDAFAKALI